MDRPDDVTDLDTRLAGEDAADLVDRLCAEQLERWRGGDRVPVETYLALHPDLAAEDEAQFELIYNEYLIRESLGEPPTTDDLVRRFPRFADRLGRQLDLHRELRGPGATALGVGHDGGAGAPEVPPKVPGYDVLEQVGRGGMGAVYKARQRGLGRMVALKIIRPWLYADPVIASRFRAEAELAARFEHPNIVPVYQVGEHAGQGFLAMEYAPGGSLQRRVSEGPMDPLEAAELVERLAIAADYAHRRGVVHRDLKPANVVLSADGAPKLTDFGLAKLMEGDGGMTRTGDIVGTPSYMAPEQAASGPGARVGPATDVYALGAILYAGLTGRPPFQGRTPLSTLEQVARHEPPPPGRLQRHTPRDLETICLKCLEKSPHRRYAGADALAEDLRRFLDGRPIRARRVSWAGQAWKWCRREPAKAALVGSLALAVLVGLVATTVLWRRAEARAAEALAGRRLAAESRSHAQDSLYVSQIARAQLEWRGAAVDRVDELLGRAEPDRRGWEWGYLRNVNHAPALVADDRSFPEAMDVAFSPDGSRLAALMIDPFNNPDGNPGLAESRVDLYELARGRRVARFAAPRAACRLSFQRGGGLLAVGGAGGDAALFDGQSGREVARWAAGGTVGFAPDGRSLVVGRAHSVALFDVDDRSERLLLDSSGGRATLAPSGRLVAVSGPAAVTIRSLPGGAVVADLPHGPAGPEGHRADYFRGEGPDLAFSPDETLLAVATDPPRVWDLARRRPARDLIGHDGPALGVAFGPDGRLVATAGRDATIRLWDAGTGAQRGVLRGHAERAARLAFHPDGHLLASGGRREGDLRVWDLTRDPEYRALPDVRPQALAFDAAGVLVAVRKSGQVIRWGRGPDRVHHGPFADLTGQFLSPAAPADFDGAAGRVATVAADRAVIAVRDLDSWRERRLAGLSRPATAVALSRDGRRAAAVAHASADREPDRREVRAWDVDSGAPLGSWLVGRSPDKHSQGAVAFSPDGDALAFDDYEPTGRPDGAWRGLVRVRPATGGPDRLRLALDEDRVLSIAFSPDGSRIAAVDINGVLAAWSSASGEPLFRRRPREPYAIFRLAFSPDGRRLAGADREKVTVWDAASGEELIVLRIHGRRPSDGGYNPRVAWSPDGLRLASSNWDGSVAIWDGGPPADPGPRLLEASRRAFAWHVGEAEAAVEAGHAAAFAFHLARCRRGEPLDAPSLLRRAALLARAGDWPACLADYRRWATSGDHDEGPAWLGFAQALLMVGDVAGYRQLCTRLVAADGPSRLQPSTWPIARALALSPDGGVDPAGVLSMAGSVPPSGKQAGRIGLTLALATYRAGRPAQAFAKALSAAESDPGRAFACWPLLVLAADRAEDAREWLVKAEAFAAGMTAGRSEGDVPIMLPEDWPGFLLLFTEATKTMGSTAGPEER